MTALRGRQTRIVATVGPASAAPAALETLAKVGVDVFRLNFSHGEHARHAAVAEAIRAVEQRLERPIAIFADLQGPKIRCGKLPGGILDLRWGAKVSIVVGEETDAADTIPLPHPELFEALQPGDRLKLDDGKLELSIQDRVGDALQARVDSPGKLTDRKGVNVPDRPIPISALTEKDRLDLAFALDLGVDYVALSFVQRPEDIDEARTLIGERAGIIAKIEKPSAVESLEGIIARADAIMVARGDLGVEMATEQVPIIQRRIVRACRAAGKPVIVATHMLESMVDAPTPTRAEASDVATAVLQGADAVMLSAESAVGRHPPTAVAIMDRIIKAAEGDEEFWARRRMEPAAPQELSTADAISQSAALIADAPDVAAIVAYTKTGSTALRVSRERPRCEIVAITPDLRTARRLRLAWGVEPALSPDVCDFEAMLQTAEAAARRWTAAKLNDRILIVTGYPFGNPGKTNTLKVSRLC